MADGYISAVQLPGDNTYDIKDKNAVTGIQINGTAQTKTNGVVNLPAYPNDTKNTAGSTNTSDKIFLIGAKSQAANPQTYSDDQVYVTNGSLYLTKTTDAEGTKDNKPALLIGNPTDDHLELDGNEVMAKGSATTTGPLYLNNNGGLVYANGKKVVRLTSDPTSGQVMIADGTDGQIKSSGWTINKSVPSNAVFTDTKNTAGSTNDSNTMYLIGAKTQEDNPQTYSNSKVYSTDGSFCIKSTNIDRDGETAPSEQTGGNGYYNLTDKDGEVVGRIRAYQNTDGGTTLGLYAYTEITGATSATSNYIQITRTKNGTNSYKVSSASNFRSAISAGSIRFLTSGDGNTAGTYSLITTDPASYVFTVPSDTKIVEFFYATNTGGGWGENIDSKRIPLSLLQSQSDTLVTLFLIGDKNWTHTYIRKRTYRITKISNYKYAIAPNNESTDAYNHGATTDLVSTGTFTITKNDNAVDLYTNNPIAVYVGY